MKKRFVVIVLDGFGIGGMADAKEKRPGDERANTLGSILSVHPTLTLPELEALGLMNAFGHDSAGMKASPAANWGKSALLHFGADTFMGHQEIMGTRPKVPAVKPFQESCQRVMEQLRGCGHKVTVREQEKLKYLLVDDYVTVADNIDADYGMAYNVTAPLDFIDFGAVLEIGRQVREVVTVNRVIPFGGRGNTIADILAAEEVHQDKFIGIHAVKSKSYEEDYHCLHLGYGVNEAVQVPALLRKKNIPTTLIGKVADIVANEGGKSISIVDTTEALDLTIAEFKIMETGFICTNVQETDLAGHSQDADWYKNLLMIADRKIAELMALMEPQDILLVCADHGNDPEIGHNKHTREYVPLLVKKQGLNGAEIGQRESLSDIGATVCEYFQAKAPENGKSFLELLH